MSGLQGDEPPRTKADRDAETWYARLQRDPRQRSRFEAWLEASPENRRAYERLTTVMGMGDLLGATGTGRTRRLDRAPAWKRQNVRYAAAAVASVVLLTVGGTAMWQRDILSSPVTVASSDEVFETSAGENRIVRLEDGSTVGLAPHSRLRTAYSPAIRRLELHRGRGRFEVAQNDRRPFVVVTPGGSVIARGTIFDISIAQEGTRVVLIHGRVEVRAAAGAQPEATAPRHFLAAGEEVLLPSEPSIAPSGDPTARRDAGQAPAMLSFDATPLGRAVDLFNDHNALSIRLADQSLARLRLTGAFRSDDPRGFAAAAAAMFALSVSEAADGSLLIERIASPDS